MPDHVGAGRKVANPEGTTVTMDVSVLDGLLRCLDALSQAQGWNRSRAVTEAIRGLLTRRKTRS